MSTTTATTTTGTRYVGFTCDTSDDCGFVACGGDRGVDTARCAAGGVCTCASRARFFIGIGLYLAALIGIALYARIRSRASGLRGAARLRDHFMATSQFGTAVMVLSIFSTAFSGYTVVGVPQETSRVGYPAMRWLTIGVFVNLGALVVYPRLRQVGIARGYNSPTDLVGDRFNCNSLRLVTSLALVIPLFIYATVQFIALADIVEGLSLGRIDRHTAAWLLCGVIVFCETMGGQRSVTISDSVQAGIMLAAFLVMPFVLVHYYGGLSEIVEEGCARSRVGERGILTGCVAYSRPWVAMQPTVATSCDFARRFTDPSCLASKYGPNATLPYLSPDLGEPLDPDAHVEFDNIAVNMLMFNLNGMAFGLNPHFLQKVFVARSDTVLKHSLMLITSAALVTNLPSLYYGLVRVAAMQDASGTAFATVTGEMIDLGGFAEIVAVVASCSALAAIMSTADSTIIGANNLLTIEWVRNFLWRDATHRQLAVVSKVVTMAFAVGALVFSFNASKIAFGALFNLQNSFVWQPAPTILAALYTDRVAAHPLLYGQLAGLVVCVAIAASTGGDWVVPSGFVGLAVNLAVVAASQLLLEGSGSTLANDDARVFDRMDPGVVGDFGPARLTAEHVSRAIMKGTIEPLAVRRNRWLCALAVGLMALGHPWYEAPYTSQAVSSGITAWALGFFVLYLIAVGIVTYVYSTWGCVEEERAKAGAPARSPSIQSQAVSRRSSSGGAAAAASVANRDFEAASPLVSDDEEADADHED